MRSSPAKQETQIYTPSWVVNTILDGVLPERNEALAHCRICDPACGDGAFLVEVARRMMTRLNPADLHDAFRNIVGYDISQSALAECRERLLLLYPNVDWQLFCADSMTLDNEGRFDRIVGNPPYVRVQNLEQDGREQIEGRWKLLRGASDLYVVFFELGLKWLKQGGVLGYIAPSSWIRTDAGKEMRRELTLNHEVLAIGDMGTYQVFDGVTTYTAITIIHKGSTSYKVPYHRFDGTKWTSGESIRLNRKHPDAPWAATSESDKERMQTLLERGPVLGDVSDIHVGIQPLADDVYILPVHQDCGEYLVCTTSDGLIELEAAATRNIVKAAAMKNGVDPVRRAVIWPYRGRTLIPEYEFSVIAPKAYGYLEAHKERLLVRDKGKMPASRWHGFGRPMTLDTGWGNKILTSWISRIPDFQIGPADSTFYAGYCVKPKYGINIDDLLAVLNSDDMDFFIRKTSRTYQSDWWSYSKRYISRFPVPAEMLNLWA